MPRQRRDVVGRDASLLWQSEGHQPEHCQVLLLGPGHNERQNLFDSEDLDSNDMYFAQLKAFMQTVDGHHAGNLLDAESAIQQLQFAIKARGQGFDKHE